MRITFISTHLFDEMMRHTQRDLTSYLKSKGPDHPDTQAKALVPN